MTSTILRLSSGVSLRAAVLALLGAAAFASAGAQTPPIQVVQPFDVQTAGANASTLPPIEGRSGTLIGTTNAGGVAGGGELYRVNRDGSYQVLYDFTTGKAFRPIDAPVQMPNGDIWGVTANTVALSHVPTGALWRFSVAGNFHVMDSFTGANGDHPTSLAIGADGQLYGLTWLGGAHGKGELFVVDAQGHAQPVFSFASLAGAINPYLGLMQASDGAFYGIAMSSETYNSYKRVIWRYTLDGTFTVLHTFDGDYPAGKLIEGPDGVLYGMTWYGPKGNGNGTVYRMNKDGSGFALLHQFDGTDGDTPGGYLNLDADGHLVGMTSSNSAGSSVVFRIGRDGSGFTVLYTFDQAVEGTYATGLHLLSSGQGYGVTGYGGSGGYGSLWQLSLPTF